MAFSGQSTTNYAGESGFTYASRYQDGREEEVRHAQLTSAVRVLQISDDLHLAHSRQLLLVRAGFVVQTVSRMAFWADAEPPAGDVVLICQTISSGEANAIASLLADRHSGAPIVRISYPEDQPLPAIHCQMPAPALPGDICNAVHLSALAARAD